jgi:predicted dehydrogenase
VRIAASAGITLGLVFQNRLRTPYLRLAELLHAGQLGRPISVAVSMRWWRADSYFAENGRGTVAKDGGGPLLNQGIHIIDQLIGLLGPVHTVSGFQAISGLRQIDTEDVAVATLRWENGAIGTLDATTTAYPGLPERIDVTGELGSASLERARLRVRLKDGTEIDEQEDASLPQVKADYLAHRGLIEDMLDALDQGRPPLANGRASLAAHALIDAMVRANDSARVELL